MSGDTPSPADYWNGRAARFGHDLRTLAYGSRLTQERKFDVLLSCVRERRVSVLDVGCGFGDLRDHMRARGFDVEYAGVDISHRIVDLARDARPDLRVARADLLSEPVYEGEQFDYVLSTGINCARQARNHDLERDMLQRMFSRCTRGMAMGLQSAAYLRRHPEAADGQSWFSDPVSLFEFALAITPWVAIRHDYMPHDFTLFLFREPRV